MTRSFYERQPMQNEQAYGATLQEILREHKHGANVEQIFSKLNPKMQEEIDDRFNLELLLNKTPKVRIEKGDDGQKQYFFDENAEHKPYKVVEAFRVPAVGPVANLTERKLRRHTNMLYILQEVLASHEESADTYVFRQPELAAKTGISHPMVSKNLEHLEENGVLRRAEAAKNGATTRHFNPNAFLEYIAEIERDLGMASTTVLSRFDRLLAKTGAKSHFLSGAYANAKSEMPTTREPQA